MTELLAPAGDLNCFYAAVNHGADAVYLGLKNFSARSGAGNFSIDELKQATDFAALFGVKVYITVNTVIKEGELFEVLKAVLRVPCGGGRLYRAGLLFRQNVERNFSVFRTAPFHAGGRMQYVFCQSGEKRRLFPRSIIERIAAFRYRSHIPESGNRSLYSGRDVHRFFRPLLFCLVRRGKQRQPWQMQTALPEKIYVYHGRGSCRTLLCHFPVRSLCGRNRAERVEKRRRDLV